MCGNFAQPVLADKLRRLSRWIRQRIGTRVVWVIAICNRIFVSMLYICRRVYVQMFICCLCGETGVFGLLTDVAAVMPYYVQIVTLGRYPIQVTQRLSAIRYSTTSIHIINHDIRSNLSQDLAVTVKYLILFVAVYFAHDDFVLENYI
jgi:hypothetical protein